MGSGAVVQFVQTVLCVACLMSPILSSRGYSLSNVCYRDGAPISGSDSLSSRSMVSRVYDTSHAISAERRISSARPPDIPCSMSLGTTWFPCLAFSQLTKGHRTYIHMTFHTGPYAFRIHYWYLLRPILAVRAVLGIFRSQYWRVRVVLGTPTSHYWAYGSSLCSFRADTAYQTVEL